MTKLSLVPPTSSSAQVANLDDYRDQATKNIVLIASGKGGVGKTWFSITLAHALAEKGDSVLIFDGDLGLANIDIQLGLTPELDLGNVVEGTCDFQDAIYSYEAGGFDIIAGRSGSGSLANIPVPQLTLLREEVKKCSNRYDWVLVDLGAGVGGIVKGLTPVAGQCILVLNDEPTTLTDAYAFLKVTRRSHPDLKVKILVNRAESEQQGQKTYDNFAEVCRRFLEFTPELAGIVLHDRRVKDAICSQTSLLTRSPSSEAVKGVQKVTKTCFRR